MGDFALRAVGLGKQYRVGQLHGGYDTLRDQVMRTGARLVGRGSPTPPSELFWAVKDVSFEIERGDVVGIIGRNGAGKTTLLRMLARITEPTAGYADVRGRLGSLLEVGTGFHPELTGRENVFLNGAILGMRRREVEAKFDQIIEFAGVEKFVDTPVKRFSSGMYVRLAFSVAAHLEPEILLVDEVLAVGDAEFQKRCLGKMEDIGNLGRTVVFVSHSMPTVVRLCERAILLERGGVVTEGPSAEVIGRYLQSDLGTTAHRQWLDAADAPGNDVARLRSVMIVNRDGQFTETVDVRDPVGIQISFDVLREHAVRPQLMITNEQGLHAFTAMDTDERWRRDVPPGSYQTTAWIPGNLLNEGLMTATVFVSTLSSERTRHHVLEHDVVAFHVVDPVEGDSAKGDHVGQWWGGVRPLLEWTSDPAWEDSLRLGGQHRQVRR